MRTTVEGPDEVTKGETVALTSTVDVRDDERVRIDAFTLTLRTAESPDEAVRVTVATNGTVLSITPSSGVVGQGEIRIAQLRRSLEVSVSGTDGAYGYGYGYRGGIDERAGQSAAEVGYGYGYGYADTAIVVEASFDSKSLKHGNYETFLAVDTAEADGRFRSNVRAFEVLVPGNGSPPDRGEGDDRRQWFNWFAWNAWSDWNDWNGWGDRDDWDDRDDRDWNDHDRDRDDRRDWEDWTDRDDHDRDDWNDRHDDEDDGDDDRDDRDDWRDHDRHDWKDRHDDEDDDRHEWRDHDDDEDDDRDGWRDHDRHDRDGWNDRYDDEDDEDDDEDDRRTGP
ncbi:hypothetical protein, partial [Halobaculum lipolyticum]|uniref:hypothetical protein n=1 Tax=Halobaculum lipolyticum TaxID=3032001 RepID=UPI0036F25E0B